ncbi:GPO family capsid scaffolding protein [Psychrobacter sp. 72-O-c]|uniref:GPO family capsid scaffolding protein n=1 Tax=Psychrobacter sp. 72-O-c TaxID=2774125 RepID=UPI001918A3E1|nr:GPO family capsid scaffolding protein [Psychrobacter sp. 72-O-c]
MADPVLPGKRVVKRFRVAREGQTVDGRSLSQQQIIDMSETYDPVEYIARINCEHMSDYWSGLNSERKSSGLGDVIAVSHGMETFTKNGLDVQLMCLYTTLSALPDLIEANGKGEKIFPSIEFYPKFADTDRAYLVGLAVTDTPASLGTEPLKFSRNSDALHTDFDQELILMTKNVPAPAASTDTTTTEQPVVQPEATQELNTQPEADGFLQKLSAMFASKKSGMSTQEQDLILQSFEKLNDKADKVAQVNESLTTQVSELETKLESLNTQLSVEPATNLTNIPPSSGAGAQLTAY